jgi:hypothetical protein
VFAPRRYGGNGVGLEHELACHFEWTTPEARQIMDRLESAGWEINLYAVPDLESFLEAALMEPASLTADFNFPERGYVGRGSGARGDHHRYGRLPSPTAVA